MTVAAGPVSRAGCWLMAIAVTVGAPAVATPLAVLNGRAQDVADSATGELLRVVSANAGGARVTVRTHPSLTLVCDAAANPTCLAWVTRGRSVRVELRREAGVGGAGGQRAPRADQWRADCAGGATPDCIVRMDRGRTVMVDWR